MANKITTTVYDSVGNTYATDVHVDHPANKANIGGLDQGVAVVEMVFYKTLADKTAGRQPFTPVNNLTDKVNIERVILVDGITDETHVFADCRIGVT